MPPQIPPSIGERRLDPDGTTIIKWDGQNWRADSVLGAQTPSAEDAQAAPRSQQEILESLGNIGTGDPFNPIGDAQFSLADTRTGLRRAARVAPIVAGLGGPLVQGTVSGVANLADQVLGLTEGEPFSGTELAAQTGLGLAGGGIQRGFQMVGSLITRGAVAVKKTIIKFSKEAQANVAQAFGVHPLEVQGVIARILQKRNLHPNLSGVQETEASVGQMAAVLDDVLEDTLNTLDPQRLATRARQIVQDGPLGAVSDPGDMARVESEIADFLNTPSMSVPKTTTRVTPLPDVKGQPPRGTIFDPQGARVVQPTSTTSTTTRVPRESITAPTAQAQKLARRRVADFNYIPGVQTPPREANLAIVRAVREGLEGVDPRVGPLNREMGQEIISGDILGHAGHRGQQGAVASIPEFVAGVSGRPATLAVASSGRPNVASHFATGIGRIATGIENAPGIATRAGLQSGQEPLQGLLESQLDRLLEGITATAEPRQAGPPRRRQLSP